MKNTKRIYLFSIFAALLALALSGWAQNYLLLPAQVTTVAAAAADEDGSSWRSTSTIGKLLYVDGFNTGYRKGTQDALRPVMDDSLANPIASEQQKEILAVPPISAQDSLAKKMGWRGWTAAEAATSSQIEQRMDEFYANPANQGVCWSEAFVIVSHSIAGQIFTDADIKEIRSTSAASGCRQ